MSKTKQPSRTWSTVLSLGIPLTIVGIASMMITFATLIDVARVNGIPFPVVFPIVVDVGMIATMITAAQFRLRGISGQWIAYVWFFTLSAVSVVANGTHALSTADMTQTTPWAASLIGAVPSATLLVITHLVMKTIPDENERAKLHALKERAHLAAARSAQPIQETVATVASPAPQLQETKREIAPAEVEIESIPALSKPRTTPVDQELVRARVLDHFTVSGERPTGVIVGEWLGGKSAKTGQRFLAKLEDEGAFDSPKPALAIVGS